MRLPREQRRRIEEKEEIAGFLGQSNISEKNLARLKALAASPDAEVARMAELVLEIGESHPYKRKRIQFLIRERKDLLTRHEEMGLAETFLAAR